MMKRITANLSYFRVNYAIFAISFLATTLTIHNPNFAFVLGVFILVGGFLGLQEHPIRIGENNILSVGTVARIYTILMILSFFLTNHIVLLYMVLITIFIVIIHASFRERPTFLNKVDQFTEPTGFSRSFQRIGQVISIMLFLSNDQLYNSPSVGDQISQGFTRTSDSVKDTFSSLKRAAKADIEEMSRNQ